MRYLEDYTENPKGFRFFRRQWIPDGMPKAILLLVHGLSDHGDRFVHMAEYFVNKGYLFVAPDLRGNGKTGGKRGHFDSTEQVMKDILFLLEETRKNHAGIPVFLYGQSMGGNLALAFGLRYPVEISGVISSSPWLRLAKPPSGIVKMAAALIRPFFPAIPMSNGLKAADLCHDREITDRYDNDPLIHWKVTPSTFFIINDGGEWAIRNAHTLIIPLLLMHGDADRITSFGASSEFASKTNPYATFKAWPGMFHELHNEPQRAKVLDFVEAWLNKVLSESEHHHGS